MGKIKILIVEDEILTAEDIGQFLDNLGYSVSAIASTGREALKKVKDDKPDLVLMDIVLQDNLTGIETAQRIREKFDIPIIYLAAYSDDKIVNAAKHTEPHGYLFKPVDFKELRTIIEIALCRHAREKEVKERLERLNLFLDPATDTLCLLDSDLVVLEVNKTGLESWGVKKEDALGKNLLDFLPPKKRKKCFNVLMDVAKTGRPFYAKDLVVPQRYGDRFINVSAFKAGDGVGLIVTEITEKKRIERALKESEDRYRLLVESMNEGVAMLDVNGVITYVNDRFLELGGHKRGEVLGHSASKFLNPGSFNFDKKPKLLIKMGNLEPYQLDWKRKDGQEIKIIVSLSSIHDEKGTFSGCVAVLTDITERLQVEEELNRSREELRSLSHHLQSIRENESKRISREIHDELGQALTALKMDVTWMSRRLPNAHKDQQKFLEKASSMSKLIDKTIQTVQKISAELRPGLLDDLGLIATVEWLAQDFQKRTGIKCRIDLTCDDAVLEPDCSTAIFRVVQEALTNVVRHAKASQVTISLKENGGELEVRIKDNGKGIKEDEISSRESLGLIGMRERLHPFGGVLKVVGVQNVGTTLSILIPLSEARRK